jgi:hypothetical protein
LASSELARPSFRSRLEVRSRRLLSTRKFTYSTVSQSQLSLVHLLASSLKPAALSCVSCNARMIARNGSLDGISSDVHDRFRPLSPHHTEREAYPTVLRTVVSLSRLWSNYNALFGMLHGLECVSRPLTTKLFSKRARPNPGFCLWVFRGTVCSRPRPPTPDPRPPAPGPNLSSGRDAAGRIRFGRRRGVARKAHGRGESERQAYSIRINCAGARTGTRTDHGFVSSPGAESPRTPWNPGNS